MQKYIWPLVILLLCGSVSHAETGYVSDMLILTMRQGPGSNYNVIQTLRSNTALEILEKGATHFKVRTVQGDVGWVEKQYITSETPKALIIERLNAKITDLEKELAAQRTATADTAATTEVASAGDDALQAAEKRVIALTKSLEAATDEKKRLKIEIEKLAAALRALKDSRNDPAVEDTVDDTDETEADKSVDKALRQENERLRAEIAALKAASPVPGTADTLKTGMIKWFLSGAAVLIAGWLLGRGMRSSRKKSRGLLG